MNALKKLLVQNSSDDQPMIGIIGDSMIDEYYDVSVSRISSEFPVPIMLSETGEPFLTLPGGAANVVNQLRAFDLFVLLLSVVDEEANEIIKNSVSKSTTIDCDIIDEKIPRKKRYFESDYPIMRMDVEKNDIIQHSNRINLLSTLEDYKNFLSFLILSDYGKGIFSNDFINSCMKFAWRHEIPTLVDPKNGPLEKWAGCTIIKPNYAEACKLTGETDVRMQSEIIFKKTNAKAVVITRGANGAHLYITDHPKHFPIIGKKVSGHPLGYSGAGDSFAAFLAMQYVLDKNKEFKERMINATSTAVAAAGLYVQKSYSSPLSLLDIKVAANDKIVEPEELFDRDFKLVMTNGCFDLFHCGHVDVLKASKELGDRLVVAVNSDASVQRLKGNSRPIIPLERRVKLLASLPFVDFVVVFNEDTPYNLINLIKPDVLVKGGDYKKEEVVGYNLVPEVVIIPREGESSTTDIVKRVAESIKES